MRLAWFTPWPPQTSGVAGCSRDIVDALSARGWGIDVFVDERLVPAGSAAETAPAAGAVRVQSAHEFAWRMQRGHYDVPVYQVGNSAAHDFLWPYLFRWPGLTVLHETRIHHARGHSLLARRLFPQYRTEFAFNQPGIEDAAEVGVSGLDGTYYYLWPMLRRVIASSRVAAVHSRGGAERLAEEFPGTPVEYVALSSGRTAPVNGVERAEMRARLGVGPELTLFGVFGALTRDKRVPEILRAFAAVASTEGGVRLLLAGTRSPHVDIDVLARGLGISELIAIEERFSDAEFDAAIGAVDVSVNLRWPTCVETSGPWLRALAAGRPTIVLDLAHQAWVPAIDAQECQPLDAGSIRPPVTVAVDLVDEERSLEAAMLRLTRDVRLRNALGTAARQFWLAEHHPEVMVDHYARAIERAVAAPVPPALASFAIDPLAHTSDLLARFGADLCISF